MWFALYFYCAMPVQSLRERNSPICSWTQGPVLTVVPGERPPRGRSRPLRQVHPRGLLEADAVHLAPGLPQNNTALIDPKSELPSMLVVKMRTWKTAKKPFSLTERHQQTSLLPEQPKDTKDSPSLPHRPRQ